MTESRLIHELKCWLGPFEAVRIGKKTHEVRVNDRDFKVHDILYLREWDEWSSEYTGHAEKVLVTYISEGGKFGLPDELCVMSIMKIPGGSK